MNEEQKTRSREAGRRRREARRPMYARLARLLADKVLDPDYTGPPELRAYEAGLALWCDDQARKGDHPTRRNEA